MMYQSIPLKENVARMIEVEAGRAPKTPSVRKQRENADCMVGEDAGRAQRIPSVWDQSWWSPLVGAANFHRTENLRNQCCRENVADLQMVLFKCSAEC